MNANEFDDLIKKKFDQHGFPYKSSSWDQFSKQLPASKKVRVIPFGWKTATGLAAGLLLAITAYTLWPVAHKNEITAIAKTIRKNTTQPIVVATADHKESAQEQTIIPTTKKHSNNNYQQKTSTNKTIIASEETTTPNTSIAQNDVSNVHTYQTKVVPPEKIDDLTPAAQYKISKEHKPHDHFYFNDDVKVASKTSIKKRTSISLTGGLNYGSLNNGFVAGVNTKQVLSNKLFLEGDLTVMSNNSNQTVSQPEYIKYQYAASVGMKPAPIQYTNTNYLYIQFNPTLGFQIMKKVSLGLGADLQTLLGNESTLVYANDQIKTLPGIDVGVTGKTEVALTPRIKAGLLYREGINNFINSSNTYLDRNYLQLQMKFRVFGK